MSNADAADDAVAAAIALVIPLNGHVSVGEKSEVLFSSLRSMCLLLLLQQLQQAEQLRPAVAFAFRVGPFPPRHR